MAFRGGSMTRQRAASVILTMRSWALTVVCTHAFLLVIGCMLSAYPVSAQTPTPGGAAIDAEIDPNPYDPRREIRRQLIERLPPLWWMSEPEGFLNTFHVLIHVPNEWQGNPVSAVMAMCPEHDDALWGALTTLELQPFYKDRRWPSVICRP